MSLSAAAELFIVLSPGVGGGKWFCDPLSHADELTVKRRLSPLCSVPREPFPAHLVSLHVSPPWKGSVEGASAGGHFLFSLARDPMLWFQLLNQQESPNIVRFPCLLMPLLPHWITKGLGFIHLWRKGWAGYSWITDGWHCCLSHCIVFVFSYLKKAVGAVVIFYFNIYVFCPCTLQITDVDPPFSLTACKFYFMFLKVTYDHVSYSYLKSYKSWSEKKVLFFHFIRFVFRLIVIFISLIFIKYTHNYFWPQKYRARNDVCLWRAQISETDLCCHFYNEMFSGNYVLIKKVCS